MTAAIDTGAIIGILVGGLVAALGYVGKLIVETTKSWRAERALHLAQLHQLRSLLQTSRAVFLVQRAQADALAKQLRSRFPEHAEGPGLENLFTHYHSRLEPAEADLHGVIRAYTEHGLKPLNESMLRWLEADIVHRPTPGKSGNAATLARKLNELDGHLRLWLAKYQAWFPNHPEHALVYLADEEKHGLGFPTGIEDVLDAILSQQTKE